MSGQQYATKNQTRPKEEGAKFVNLNRKFKVLVELISKRGSKFLATNTSNMWPRSHSPTRYLIALEACLYFSKIIPINFPQKIENKSQKQNGRRSFWNSFYRTTLWVCSHFFFLLSSMCVACNMVVLFFFVFYLLLLNCKVLCENFIILIFSRGCI